MRDRLSYQMIADRIRDYALQAQVKANVHTYRHCCATDLCVAGPAFVSCKQQEFTDLLEKIYQDYGEMQKATALAYKTEVDSAVGHRHVIISDLEFERARARERLVLMRGEDGRMLLWDMVIEPQ